MQDSQKKRVYRWENEYVAPHDTTVVPFAQIESLVHYVWEKEGLQYPPQVIPMPKQRNKTATGARLRVRFQEKTYTWIILHELAHAMSSVHDGRTNGHGPIFLGIYCQLLQRYLHLNIAMLKETAEQYGLEVNLEAKPVFI